MRVNTCHRIRCPLKMSFILWPFSIQLLLQSFSVMMSFIIKGTCPSYAADILSQLSSYFTYGNSWYASILSFYTKKMYPSLPYSFLDFITYQDGKTKFSFGGSNLVFCQLGNPQFLILFIKKTHLLHSGWTHALHKNTKLPYVSVFLYSQFLLLPCS